MNLLKTENQFSHEIFGNLTTITNENNDVYFIGKEVAEILEYRDFSRLKERLDDEETFHLNHADAKALFSDPADSGVGFKVNNNGLFLLTEAGFYSAIIGSQKPDAKVFKKWVTSEVLPAIRKTGSYQVKPLTTLEILTHALRAEEARLLAEEEKRKLLVENTNLNTVLDNLTDWVSIIKVATHNKISEKLLNWRTLKKMSTTLGYVIKKAESPRYGYQNLYHIDCFKACYSKLDYDFKENNKFLGN